MEYAVSRMKMPHVCDCAISVISVLVSPLISFVLDHFCFYRMLDQILSTRIMVKKALKDHKNDKVS